MIHICVASKRKKTFRIQFCVVAVTEKIEGQCSRFCNWKGTNRLVFKLPEKNDFLCLEKQVVCGQSRGQKRKWSENSFDSNQCRTSQNKNLRNLHKITQCDDRPALLQQQKEKTHPECWFLANATLPGHSGDTCQRLHQIFLV